MKRTQAWTVVNGRTASYTPSEPNEYTERRLTGYGDALGEANAVALTVNGTATTGQGKLFQRQSQAKNSSPQPTSAGEALHQQVTVEAIFGSDSDIFFSRSTDNGETWSPMVVLNSNAASDSATDERPSIACDPSGIKWKSVREIFNAD